MEPRHPIDNQPVRWRRCKSVRLRGDQLIWELSQSGWYDFMDVYRQRPHREMISADSDEALGVFVRKWGPLRHLDQGQDSLSWYREQRDLLSVSVRLISATESRSGQRSALLTLMRLQEPQENNLLTFTRVLGGRDQLLNDPERWCKSASISEVDKLCVEIVNEFSLICVPRLMVEGRGRNRVVRAGLFINNLMEALMWMLWQDVYRQKAFEFCVECGKLIWSDNRHRKKFCPGGLCARRKTDREWKQRKRTAASRSVPARTKTQTTSKEQS